MISHFITIAQYQSDPTVMLRAGRTLGLLFIFGIITAIWWVRRSA